MKISTTRRPGMTLIEILVVIAIIAILASLLLGGVMAFLRKGPETITKHDIGQLANAMGRFYSDYKFYPPSKIRLCSNRKQPGGYNTNPANTLLDATSLKAISAVWPNIDFNDVRWDGTATPNQDYILEGDQCLVFFLNGLSTDPKFPMGDPKNPTSPMADKKKFFTFDAGRLKSLNPASPMFPSYVDGYGQMPFVYFSSGTRPNGYETPIGVLPVNRFGLSPFIDKPATATTPATYYNSTTFQIISAGLDLQFGPGGLSGPATANMMPAAGKDDLSNFHDKVLGAP